MNERAKEKEKRFTFANFMNVLALEKIELCASERFKLCAKTLAEKLCIG